MGLAGDLWWDLDLAVVLAQVVVEVEVVFEEWMERLPLALLLLLLHHRHQ